ncbi:MAG: hypothetical protein ACQPRJ_06295 [Solitalea-like symbiont of Acarus siro]
MNKELENILLEKYRLGKEKRYLNLFLDKGPVDSLKDFIGRVNVLFPGTSKVRISTLVENLIYEFLDKYEKDIDEIVSKTTKKSTHHKN